MSFTLEQLQAKTDEHWKPIPRYRGKYEVSDLGRVRSFKRVGRMQNKPRIMRMNVTGEGYNYVQLRRDGRTWSHKVARLVADAFISNPLSLPIVNHIDAVRTNDMVNNLEWCTQSHNLAHAYRIGTKVPVRGEDSVHAKLSNQDVRTIRRMSKESYSLRAIAEAYSVSHTTIRKILSFSKWKHVA